MKKFIKTNAVFWADKERAELIETILHQEDMLIELEDKLLRQEGKLVEQGTKLLVYEKQLGEQQGVIEQRDYRIKELEVRTNLNSQNSSKPPSTDVYEKKRSPKSLREKTGRKTGGQPGHLGTTLQAVAIPDAIEKHDVTKCEKCSHDLSNVPVSGIVKRQVIDIPQIKPVVTEHQMASKKCPSCKAVTVAPKVNELSQSIQYGIGVKVLAAYFNNVQHIPLERLAEMFKESMGLEISEGTLVNMLREMAALVRPAVEHIKEELKNAEGVMHSDESGTRIEGELAWVHSASTEHVTLYEAHKKRGSEAMDKMGVLPEFKGTLKRDDFSAYNKYEKSRPSACGAHYNRDLNAIIENHAKQQWATEMRSLLSLINNTVNSYKAKGETRLPETLLKKFSDDYDAILVRALPQIPIIKPPPQKKRGRQKQHPAKNLYDRLLQRKESLLLFMYDFTVPFTNNQAERDLRMVKLKVKISGGYRSRGGAEEHLAIRSYVSTARKQNVGVYGALHEAIKWRPIKFYNRPNVNGH